MAFFRAAPGSRGPTRTGDSGLSGVWGSKSRIQLPSLSTICAEILPQNTDFTSSRAPPSGSPAVSYDQSPPAGKTKTLYDIGNENVISKNQQLINACGLDSGMHLL